MVLLMALADLSSTVACCTFEYCLLFEEPSPTDGGGLVSASLEPPVSLPVLPVHDASRHRPTFPEAAALWPFGRL
jgi:hypothetical protein